MIQGVWWCSRLKSQIERLLTHGTYAPFALAIGIGRAGERVAQQLHARTGWFPHISRVDITRQEDGYGGYHVVTTSGIPLAQQLPMLDAAPSLAVVDDTVFSGLTMRTVLQALPAKVRARTQAFCLRGVAASLASIMALCPIAIGFAAPGNLLDEVSFINASGLVLRVGIRRSRSAVAGFFRACHVDAGVVSRLCGGGHRRVPAPERYPGARRPACSVPLRRRRQSANSWLKPAARPPQRLALALQCRFQLQRAWKPGLRASLGQNQRKVTGKFCVKSKAWMTRWYACCRMAACVSGERSRTWSIVWVMC